MPHVGGVHARRINELLLDGFQNQQSVSSDLLQLEWVCNWNRSSRKCLTKIKIYHTHLVICSICLGNLLVFSPVFIVIIMISLRTTIQKDSLSQVLYGGLGGGGHNKKVPEPVKSCLEPIP